MHKLQLSGTFFSLSIIELNKSDALYLQNIMEKELVTYDKIFFERKDFRKLGFKTFDELPVVKKITGFLSSSMDKHQNSGILTHLIGKKKVFMSDIERLESKFHTKLYDEYCDVKSFISHMEINFRKKKGFKYFFLKNHQQSTFTFAIKDDFRLNQLFFKHTVYHFKFAGMYSEPLQLLEVYLNDSKLEFSSKPSETFKFISALK